MPDSILLIENCPPKIYILTEVASLRLFAIPPCYPSPTAFILLEQRKHHHIKYKRTNLTKTLLFHLPKLSASPPPLQQLSSHQYKQENPLV
jgi:hypothetical protein